MNLYHFTPEARLNLLEIRDYIALDNPDAAARQIREIKVKCQFLGMHPRLTAPQKRYGNLSKHSCGNYIILYRPAKSGVEIMRVYHMSQDIEALLKKSLH